MAYPTLDEILDASTVAELTDLTEDQQEALRITSITAIEDYCGQSFAEEFEGEVEVESVAGFELYLPRRLVSFEEAGPSGGDPYEATALAITDGGSKLVWRPNVVGVGYYSQALYEVSGGDYAKSFPNGFVTINGVWGWADAPAGVATALRFDMEDAAIADANALTPSVNYARSMGLKAISQGNLNVELGALPSFSPRVERLLEPYRFLGRLGRLV